MFNVKNNTTGRIIKECCSKVAFSFESKDKAQEFADAMRRDSVLHTKRRVPCTYSVVPAA